MLADQAYLSAGTGGIAHRLALDFRVAGALTPGRFFTLGPALQLDDEIVFSKLIIPHIAVPLEILLGRRLFSAGSLWVRLEGFAIRARGTSSVHTH